MEEGPAMVSYLTGSMNTLLDKLTKLQKRPDIIEELQHLVILKEGFFDKLAGRREMDEQVKEWMKQVRELVFDIEDWIDQKPETKNTGESKREEKIEEFKTLVQEACHLCTEYKLLDEAPTCGADVAGVAPSEVTIDSRLLLGDKTCLVALDRPKEELKKHLMDEQKKLKVVSIVGTGGLGKTILAKEVHGELLREFQCGAFVHIGRNPSVRTILVNILYQTTYPLEQDGVSRALVRERYGSFESLHEREVFSEEQTERNAHVAWLISKQHLDEQEVIDLLWEFLTKKRYFIVLDGIWSIRAWRAISCALPDNNLGSRILTTTRIKDVADSCSPRYTDIIHQMKALSEEVSERLFVEQAKRPADDDILKLCCGMPLAIIVAAGLLPRKSEELAEPKILGKSILLSLDQYSTSERMTKILRMSYADLSLPVQSCFLYLSVFPENYTIKKDRLILLWGAEGFIPRRDEESLWVTGERYFNELIRRRLIQPVFDYNDDQAVGCTVHSVILDFIRSLSREENFATTAAELCSSPFPCDTIRRFSLDCSNEDEAGTMASSTAHLSSTRSLTVFGDIEGSMYSEYYQGVHAGRALPVFEDLLSAFKLIRVLDLQDNKNLKNHHLQGIGGLVLLRYLGLGGTGITKLPEEIGELEQLETLDLRRNRLQILPASRVRLRKLVHLLLDTHVLGIDEIWEMQGLEEVSNIGVHHIGSYGLVGELLSKSKRLRTLGLTLGELPTETNLTRLLEVVAKYNLQSLSLHCLYNDLELLLDSWEKVAVTFEPRRFELKFSTYSTRVLSNMASLVSLTHLCIKIHEIVKEEDLDILGGLPNLVLLNLSSDSEYPTLLSSRERWIVKKDIFPCLKVLSFTFLHGGMWLSFTPGAMPQLQRLRLHFSARETLSMCGGFDFGIQHLSCLTRVHATINCKYATVSEVERAEAAIRKQVSKFPIKPTIEFSRACI